MLREQDGPALVLRLHCARTACGHVVCVAERQQAGLQALTTARVARPAIIWACR